VYPFEIIRHLTHKGFSASIISAEKENTSPENPVTGISMASPGLQARRDDSSLFLKELD
jgi:hypothetical protein